MKWATDNDKQIRGHTLRKRTFEAAFKTKVTHYYIARTVWYKSLPDWVKEVTDKEELTTVIQNHISNVAGHFAGKLYGKLSYVEFVINMYWLLCVAAVSAFLICIYKNLT